MSLRFTYQLNITQEHKNEILSKKVSFRCVNIDSNNRIRNYYDKLNYGCGLRTLKTL